MISHRTFIAVPGRPWLLRTITCGATLLIALPSFAACTTPTGSAGDMIYNTTYDVMQYCNGTDWMNMGAVVGDTGTETDPEVGTLTASNFCKTNAGGTAIDCSVGSISLSADVTGNLPVANLNSGTSASATTFWRGDGTWAAPSVSISADSINFTDLSDTLTLDASTDIAVSSTNALSITNTGTGDSLVVNDAASDTTPFVIDASGNVGIGTTSPSAPLEVSTNATNAFAGQFLAPNTGGTGIYGHGSALGVHGDSDDGIGISGTSWTGNGVEGTSNSGIAVLASANDATARPLVLQGAVGQTADLLQWRSSAATLGVITAAGNVGIGTTNPGYKLDIYGGNARINRASNSSILYLGDTTSGNWESDIQFISSDSVTNWRIASNRLIAGALSITPSTATGGSTFTTPAMLITSTGNVGIGTTSPSEKLDIGGGNIKMGYEQVNNTCNPATSCAVSCSSGKQPLGGGCAVATNALMQSYPTASGWFCMATGSTYIVPYAICANIK